MLMVNYKLLEKFLLSTAIKTLNLKYFGVTSLTF